MEPRRRAALCHRTCFARPALSPRGLRPLRAGHEVSPPTPRAGNLRRIFPHPDRQPEHPLSDGPHHRRRGRGDEGKRARRLHPRPRVRRAVAASRRFPAVWEPHLTWTEDKLNTFVGRNIATRPAAPRATRFSPCAPACSSANGYISSPAIKNVATRTTPTSAPASTNPARTSSSAPR